jgi:hypothetical protein
VAHRFIAWAGTNIPPLLLICIGCLSVGRVLGMTSTSLVVVVLISAVIVVALGVMNTAISSAVTRLADRTQVGGLFGILDAVESGSGIGTRVVLWVVGWFCGWVRGWLDVCVCVYMCM